MSNRSSGDKSRPSGRPLPKQVVLREGREFTLDDDKGAIRRVLGELARCGYDRDQARRAKLRVYVYDAANDTEQRAEHPIEEGYDTEPVENLAQELSSYMGVSTIDTIFDHIAIGDWAQPRLEICLPGAVESRGLANPYKLWLTERYLGRTATIMEVDFQPKADA